MLTPRPRCAFVGKKLYTIDKQKVKEYVMIMEHRGRKLNETIRKRVKELRKKDLSYADIARTLGMKSRQLARYYGLWITRLTKKK